MLKSFFTNLQGFFNFGKQVSEKERIIGKVSRIPRYIEKISSEASKRSTITAALRENVQQSNIDLSEFQDKVEKRQQKPENYSIEERQKDQEALVLMTALLETNKNRLEISEQINNLMYQEIDELVATQKNLERMTKLI